MKRKKWLVLFLVIALFSPLSVFGEERDDQVGISFKAEQPIDPKDPDDPKDPSDPSVPQEPNPDPKTPAFIFDVPPLTLGSAKNYSLQASSRKGLPKTGEIRQAGMQWLGIGCVACSFWLFLFTRLKEEEDDGQKA